jgi:hypothetical protein
MKYDGNPFLGIEKAFEYHAVIENIKLVSDYYKKISIYTFMKDVE